MISFGTKFTCGPEILQFIDIFLTAQAIIHLLLNDGIFTAQLIQITVEGSLINRNIL